MKYLKMFLFTILKSLHPKYFFELSRQDIWTAWKHFLKVILFAFVIMGIIAIPLLFFVKADIERGVLEISQFDLNANVQTLKPITIPNYDPVIVIDTTNNHTFADEWFMITNRDITYKYLGENRVIKLESFKFTENRDKGIDMFKFMLIFLLPGLFVWYYIIYAIKYLLIIVPFAVISYFFSRFFKNKVGLKEMIVLSFYTATPMILLEILSMPFFIKKFLLNYSPFIGINFSLIAICLYLIFFVTAIRLNGNKDL